MVCGRQIPPREGTAGFAQWQTSLPRPLDGGSSGGCSVCPSRAGLGKENLSFTFQELPRCGDVQFPSTSAVPCCFPSRKECVCYTPAHPCARSSPSLHGRACSCSRYFISSPQHSARCQKNTTVQSVCGDVKACPEPSKYRCAEGRLCSPAAGGCLSWGCPKQGLSTGLGGVQGLIWMAQSPLFLATSMSQCSRGSGRKDLCVLALLPWLQEQICLRMSEVLPPPGLGQGKQQKPFPGLSHLGGLWGSCGKT